MHSGSARPPTSCAGCWGRSPASPAIWRRTSRTYAAHGQLDEAKPLVVQLEFMVQELIREVNTILYKGL